MKVFLLLVFIVVSIYAKDNLSQFIDAYKAKDMSQACALGRQLFHENMRDEKILIASGHACAEDDYINFIGVLQQRLGKTPASRKANVYFSTLLLKKRLISEYMHEDADLSPYTLPLTDHILSQVFEAIKVENFISIAESPKHIRIDDDRGYIDVSVSNNKVYVKVYKEGRKISEHRYR